MKTIVRGQKFRGYYGPEIGLGNWLFARKAKGFHDYAIAYVENGQIALIDNEQAFRGFTNEEVAKALLAAK